MDLHTVSQLVIVKLSEPTTLLISFWVLVALVIFISLLLLIHWKEYGENLAGGLFVYIFYGIGTCILLGNVYKSIQTILNI